MNDTAFNEVEVRCKINLHFKMFVEGAVLSVDEAIENSSEIRKNFFTLIRDNIEAGIPVMNEEDIETTGEITYMRVGEAVVPCDS